MVHLVNKGSKISLRWDGEDFDLKKDEKKKLDESVAKHFIEKFQKDKDVKLEIQEIKDEPKQPRKKKDDKKDEKAFKDLG